MQEAENNNNYAPPSAPVADLERLLAASSRGSGCDLSPLRADGDCWCRSFRGLHRWTDSLSRIVWGSCCLGGCVFHCKRSRVARGVLVVFTLLALGGVASSLNRGVSQTTVSGLAAWVGLIVRVSAAILLFTEPANAWD
jgi:hypothetical protein